MVQLERLKSKFLQLIDLNLPIISIVNHDFSRVDNFLNLCLKGKDVVEWNPALGTVGIKHKNIINENSLFDFLKEQYLDPSNNKNKNGKYIVLKECSDFIEGKYDKNETLKLNTLLLMMAQKRLYHNTETDEIYETEEFNFNVTIILVSTGFNIPEILRKYITDFDMGVPDEEEIKELIEFHVHNTNPAYQIDEDSLMSICTALKGLTAFDIDRTLDWTMYKNGTIDSGDRSAVELYKKNIVKQSGVLELVTISSDKTIDNIGGGIGLKKYLQDVSVIFNHISEAKSANVNVPKGIFLAGMPGCGKSQCAKAASILFNLPLLKMDMGQLMGKYVGESEANMRKALKVAESAAPCILFVDEIEKAFSGADSDSNGVTRRMFGHFLSWLQDKESLVYVIATANKLNGLPPELKRKGRFDEIFCIDLPTKTEREDIFKIYLKGIKTIAEEKINELAEKSAGFSGADIESVINEAHKRLFLENVANPEERKIMDTDFVKTIIEETTSISDTCGDQIEQMKNDFLENKFLSAATGKPMSKKDYVISDGDYDWEFPYNEYDKGKLRRKKKMGSTIDNKYIAIGDIQGIIKK